MRLKEFTKLVPSDIVCGYVKLKGNSYIKFYDIAEVSAQYAMDYVESFDIIHNETGRRAIVICLVNN